MSPLNELPTEVITDIINLLDYHTLPNIRLTSHFFASFIPQTQLSVAFQIAKLRLLYSECLRSARLRNDLSSNPTAHKYINHVNTLLQLHLNDEECDSEANRIGHSTKHLSGAEPCHTSIVPELLPCYFCLKYVPYGNFVPSQVKRKRAFGHVKCIHRFCNDCAVRKKKWARGEIVFTGKGYFRVCERCGMVEALRRESGCGRKPHKVCQKCHILEHDGSKQEDLPSSRFGRKLGMRAGRCQRCWAVSHEERAGEYEEGGQLMCSECFDTATKVREPSVTSDRKAEDESKAV